MPPKYLPLEDPKCPEAYKRKKQNFYGRDFKVIIDQVLIPRPETEQLIDIALSLAGKSSLPGVTPPARILPEHPVIADVGCGSGCIGITLKLELPESTIYTIDSSKHALRITQKNCNIHNTTDVQIIRSDLLSHLTFHPDKAQKFINQLAEHDIPMTIPDRSHIDLVIANLPYVDPTWEWLDKQALIFEPPAALYADDHGLALIKKLIDQVSEMQIPHLILEADPCQHDEVVTYATSAGYNSADIRGFALYFKYAG